MGFSELKKRVKIESSGHLQFHLSRLNGLVESTPEGSYKLTDNGREAMRIIGTVKKTAEADAKYDSKNGVQKFSIAYSLAVFITLSFLSIYLLSYQENTLPPRTYYGAPLESFYPTDWDDVIPFYIKPNQSVTLTYTVNYNWTYPSSLCSLNSTYVLIEEYTAPENTFEVYEYDLGSYSYYIYDVRSYPYPVNSSYRMMVEVYSPEDKLLHKIEHEPPSFGGDLGWPIDKPGTYRIVISNSGPSELEVRSMFQFTRVRF